MKELVSLYKDKIDNRLRIFLDKRISHSSNISESAKEIMRSIKEFNLRGGKRIRPILVVLGYKAVGGKNEKAVIDAALAVELMESFLLVHDDIIDQDEMRRGYLTIHKVYENKAKRIYKNIDYKRYGENISIIIGDILSALGSEAILNANFPIKRKIKAIEKFNKVIINTCFGQVLDINYEIRDNIKEKDIKRIQQLKTAVYTIEGPLHIGAILGGANNKKLRALSSYALPLGQAFQIQDDILGLFGEQKKIGKPIGSDIKEGKKTLLIIKALEKADKKESLFIKKCLGNKKITENDIEKIREIVKSTGSLKYSEDLAKKLIEKAKSSLINLNLRKKGKKQLLNIADYIVNREK